MFITFFKQSLSYFILTTLIIFIFLFFVVFDMPVQAAQPSSDAIAIRVVPNPNNYSALRWYQEQDFTGSPQLLLVDGYQAIRDGRTVYVNAANVIGNELYTNIYIISYSQEAESATIDIFGHILSHWKFNTNITTVGICDQTTDIACLSNTDCPANEYCLSQKAKIIRDVKRLADLAEFSILFEQYKNNHGYYPRLESGSYLPHKTMSVWPSWQETLANKLGSSLPVDPINKLGDCGEARFNPTTCWDEHNQEFATSLDIPEFPTQSRVYFYSTDSQGSTANYCAQMETNYANINLSNCFIDVMENNPPSIINVNLPTAYSGLSYQGYIEAADPDGDLLTWSIDTLPGAPWDLWSSAPLLVDTAMPEQKIIRASLVGRAGDYDFDIIIDDSKVGGQIIRRFTITTVNSNLPIIQPESNKSVIIGQVLDFTITASEVDSQYPLAFMVTGNPRLPSGLSGVLVNQHDYQISGTVVDQTQDYAITVVAADLYQGFSSPINFTITVQNNPPSITSTPNTKAETCIDYSYDVDATDPDSHTISYLASSLPTNLVIDSTTGVITGQPHTPGTYNITITARDQYYSNTISPYSAEDQQTYTLDVAGYSVNTISDATVYTCPLPPSYPADLCPYNVYHSGVTFIDTASITTSNPVTYSLQNNPLWFVISPSSGTMNGTPTDHDNDPGSYTITVVASNSCGFSASTNFTLTVLANEWCGDSITQVVQGEECDDGNADSLDTCDTEGINPGTNGLCSFTFCGDDAIQSPNAFGVNEQCDDGADGDDTNQCDDNCSFTYCGDNIIQNPNGQGTGGPANDGNEVCDGGVGSYDCTDFGFDFGTLVCTSCSYDTSGCANYEYCTFDVSTLGTTMFDSCIIQF